MRLSLSPRLIAVAAVLVAAAVVWGLGRPLPDIEQQRRHFADLQRRVARAEQDKAARQADRGRVLRLRAQARAAAGAQQAAFTAEADQVARRLGWGDAASVRADVLDAPVVTLARTTTLPGIPDARPERGNGCLACHLGAATPGFEQYPTPFRTHSRLATYVGAASPHPPSRVGCTSCHQGDEYADSFAAAGHVRATPQAGAVPAMNRTWTSAGADGSMLPLPSTEAGCVTCHVGERYQPGAPALSEALTTIERAGCYACHQVPGMERTPRRAPDLRRIRGKLSPAWVGHWLANPAAVKPATWMPRFWADPDAPASRAAIAAIVSYLFAQSDGYVPALASTPKGDAARGRALVDAVGCLGCHVAGDADRDTTSLRRTFGQPLQGIANKTTAAWLVDWLRDPARYSPGTRMPNLRLTVNEASDIAAWLQTLEAPAPPVGAVTPDDGAFRAVLQEYDASTPAATLALTGAALREAAGRTVIDALGCFNCHEIRGFDGRTTTAPLRARPYWDDGLVASFFARAESTTDAAAARADVAPHRGTLYRFGPGERRRLALALTAVAGPLRETHALTTPWHLAKVAGRALTHERNCVGCHPIEGTGGDLVSLVAEPTLGPPLLTPEGARVQPAWLRGFLHEPSTIRPWISVRMPTFGLSPEAIETVGGYFRGIAPESPKPSPATEGATAADGRALFDLLKCQQCHVLGTIPTDQPTSNLAPDLRLARTRLQPDWILSWLRDPSSILPGTRMPTFWPDYPASFYEPLGKDGAKQVRAIRDHLLTLR
ncbi:MAG: c-type cytochrome [Vicinamibacterales bacterium]